MKRNHPKERSNAFTLLEMIVTVLLIGIIVFVTVPNIRFDLVNEQIGDATAQKLVTDLRLAQQLAISNAIDNSDGFVLEMEGAAPYSGYSIKNLDTNEIVRSHSIDSKAQCSGGDRFEFGPLGNLIGGATQLVISAEAKTFTVTITPGTGRVELIEN